MTESPERFSIEREEAGGGGRFVLAEKGVRLGWLDYTRDRDGTIRVEHVEVLPAARGSGLGRRLVDAAVQWARETQSALVPICPYAKFVIAGDPGMHDVLRSAV